MSRGPDARSLGTAEEPDPSIPWRPARTPTERLAETELPSTLSATIAQCVYVRDQNLPPALIDAMRRLAVFSNPRFLELQAMRMSTARTPRVISCFEQTSGYLVLPRGCRGELEKLLACIGVTLEMADERAEGEPLDIEFTGTLTALQDEAVSALLGHDLGVVCAPPGIGKTVIASRLIAERGRSTLVLVHRKPLLEQWVKRLCEFLDLRPEDIGTIGGGRGRSTGVLDVAMVQSLARHHTRDELLSRYGHVVVDECHHVPAVTTERVLRSAPARYVTGLTATPKRRDGHHPIIKMQCGPVRHTIRGNASRLPHPFAQRVVRRETPFDPATLPPDPHIQEIFTALAADEVRTEMVANDTLQLAAQGRRPLVLTERREHLERLAAHLERGISTLIILHGDMRAGEHRHAREQLSNADSGRVVLATGRYIGEGFDDPLLDTLLLAMPIAWKGTVIQYAGRLHRGHEDKRDVLIFDYVDSELPVLRRMFTKRLRAYRALGYELADAAPVSLCEAGS